MYNITVKTLEGLEEILAKELNEIGAKDIKTGYRAVFCSGDDRILYRANLECRTALKVLKPIRVFNVSGEEDLYEKIKKINWLNYLSLNETFRIDATVSSKLFNHSKYVALKAKDALADQFREKTEKRPNVDTFRPNLRINIHIRDKECTVSLDSSGEILSKRGYRTKANLAPLSEVLAAGLIKLTGWQADCDFYDPMCGSGTFLIEAAMIAKNIPAGYFRDEFGFELWRDFDRELWAEVFTQAERKIKESDIKISGSDIDWQAIKITKNNIANANLTDFIEVKKFSFEKSQPSPGRALVVMNPPYGERMEAQRQDYKATDIRVKDNTLSDKQEEINTFYKAIGDKLKQDYQNKEVWIITSNFEGLKNLGLRTSKRINMKNAALETKFVKYEMYAGTRKVNKTV